MLTRTRTKGADDVPAGPDQDARRSGRGRRREPAAPGPLAPTLPSVNLLPPAVVEQAQLARTRRRAAMAVGLAVAAVAAGYLLQSGSISSAEADLAAEQARSTSLAGRAAELAPVQLYYATVDANRTTIQETMAREVLVSDVLDQLFGTTPPGVTLETVDLTVDTAPVPPAGSTPGTTTPGTTAPGGAATGAAATCPSPDPYALPGATAGCISISGSAGSRQALGAWERRLDRTEVFTDLFISDSKAAATPAADGGTGTSTGPITFSATVSVTAAAYAARYADPAFVEETDE